MISPMIDAYALLALITYILIGIYYEGIDRDKREDICLYDRPPICKRIIILWPLIRHAPKHFGTTDAYNNIPDNRNRSRLF